ncbi:MAG: sulfatase-like hydrolase/transferase [Pseudomonadales bacterium]
MKFCRGNTWLMIVCAMMLIAKPALADSTALSNVLPPNVLVIVADDLGVGDLRSFTPAAAVDTPSINALAAQGMRFSRFYTDSTCSASRAALLTGQASARLGFHPVARGISPEVVTMPEWLRDMGYSTHLVGKWHIGEVNADAMPWAQGFDSFFGYLNQWFLQGPDQNGRPVVRAPVYENPLLQNERGTWQQYSGYLPDILTQYASNQIIDLKQTAKPWFMLYATPLVHGPLYPPPEVADQHLSDDEKYQAMLRHLDSNVAELLAALDKSEQRDNTIIIFLSDNGAPEKRTGSNGGFAGGKAHYSEGAVRTPMFWVDKGKVLPKSLDERAITIEDIFPTLAARLGRPLPFATDGVDFKAVNSIKQIIDRPLFWMSRGSSSILSADKQWGIAEGWTFRLMQSEEWWKIGDRSTQNETERRWLSFRKIAQMKQQFVQWLDAVSQTQVKQALQTDGSRKITENDFLRTPLKEWDFYVALTVDATEKTEQVIAEQSGAWLLRYDPAQKKIKMDMYGHHWEVPYDLSSSDESSCTLLGLNADLYDRYTNISKTINPTKLLLSIDGKEQARTEWQIDSLADVKTSEPTWLGVSAAQKSRWQGKMSAAIFYHRANQIGEWPYFLDEIKLKKALCAQIQ